MKGEFKDAKENNEALKAKNNAMQNELAQN